ncbi:MAG: HTH-type transcriptional regulator BhcR [Rhizobiaceae bacterium]
MGSPPKRARGRPKSLFHPPQPSTIRALDKGLTVLKELARSGAVTLSELAESIDMPPSSTHRILTTLQHQGFAELDDTTQQWSIGIEAFRAGSAYLVRSNLVEAAMKTMRRLMEETGETANLAIADAGDVVFIAQVEAHNPIRAFFRPGTRGPLHSSGIGKALLASMQSEKAGTIIGNSKLEPHTPKTLSSAEALNADLEAIRDRGWSLDNEERYLGMRCVAATIYNAFGEPVAGISVSGPTVRFPDNDLEMIGSKVKDAADEVTGLIGGAAPKR